MKNLWVNEFVKEILCMSFMTHFCSVDQKPIRRRGTFIWLSSSNFITCLSEKWVNFIHYKIAMITNNLIFDSNLIYFLQIIRKETNWNQFNQNRYYFVGFNKNAYFYPKKNQNIKNEFEHCKNFPIILFLQIFFHFWNEYIFILSCIGHFFLIFYISGIYVKCQNV